jgi:hypothetical protein
MLMLTDVCNSSHSSLDSAVIGGHFVSKSVFVGKVGFKVTTTVCVMLAATTYKDLQVM